MKKTIKILSILVLLATLTSPLKGQSTSVFDANYFDKNNSAPPIKIGKGFHINDIYKQTRSCFTTESSNTNNLTAQQIGGKKTNIRIYYTKTNEEFNSYKNRGFSGRVSFLNLFAMSGLKLEEYSETSINTEERLIFTANVDFGNYFFESEPTLIPEAKNLIDQNQLQDFVKIFGTHYINGVRKASSISVILTKVSSKLEEFGNNTSTMQANSNIPFKGSGSFEVENLTWTNKQLNENNFSVLVEINGPEIDQNRIQTQIYAIITGDEDNKTKAISEIIGSAIKNISDPDQSSITQYYYAPFSLYGLDGIFWDEKKQIQLIKINEAVLYVFSAKSRLNELISIKGKEKFLDDLRQNNVPKEYFSIVTSKYYEIIPILESMNKDVDKYLKSLEYRYINCSNVLCPGSDDCCNNEFYLKEIYKYNFNQLIEQELEKILVVERNIINEINKPECEKRNQGIITIKNISINPYYLYCNNKFVEIIPGNSTKTYFESKGTYLYKAVQKSGYLMYPTENIRSANITNFCQEVIFKIGFQE
jgi:hypothetical protein